MQVHRIIEPDKCHRSFIATIGRSIIVSFKGTDTFKNALTDMNLTPAITGENNFLAQYPNASVHEGFLKYYLEQQKEILETIQNMIRSSQFAEIIFVGHSLGGAAATLAALDASSYFKNQRISLYTYGEPRSGNQAFANAVNAIKFRKSFRVVYGMDPVPHVPLRDENLNIFPPFPKITPYNYHHRKNEVFIENDGMYTIKTCNDELDEDKNCSLSQYYLIRFTFPLVAAAFAKNALLYHNKYFPDFGDCH
jgi:hypothetical protein